MPELPEVENVCIGLRRAVIGQVVTQVSVRRAEVVRGSKQPAALLRGQAITRIDRLGKQLALVGAGADGRGSKDPPCVCVHLGMTGSVRVYAGSEGKRFQADKHTHIVWHLANGDRVAFRDPRRFGGVWTFGSVGSLRTSRWSKIGDDALTITPTRLHAGLNTTQRALKAALLDQAVVAGLGNIYVDELLHACGISPLRPGCEISLKETQQLVRRMRPLLNRAIRQGGSTLRDYVDSSGQTGGFQQQHRVYGRSDQPCMSCGQVLMSTTIAGRTTVYCRGCQA